ncbi:MAG: HAD hydrolase-like protein [Clostridiales bacterium]|nr:HAD hydrolase-like protein [Clostridiales bacterium]
MPKEGIISERTMPKEGKMPEKTDGIILDVDGTLWDSTGIVAKAWTRAVRENGCPDKTVTPEMLQALFGKPMNVIADNLLPDLTPEHRQQIMKVCCDYEQRALREELPTRKESDADRGRVDYGNQSGRDDQTGRDDRTGLRCDSDCNEEACPICYPKVTQTIRELAGKLPVFIVSNCQAGYIEMFLEKTGLSDCITDFECFGNNGKSKGENIRLVSERNGLKTPIYVGDTQGDCDASTEAGVAFVYAKYGFGTVDHADAVIGEFAELREIIS